MQWNRKYFMEYIEIYLEASIELVKQKDAKYIKKFRMERKNIGNRHSLNIPLNYDLKINMNEMPTIENSVDKILNKIATYHMISLKININFDTIRISALAMVPFLH